MSQYESLELKDPKFYIWRISQTEDNFNFNLETKEKLWNLFKQESIRLFIQLKSEMKEYFENIKEGTKEREKEKKIEEKIMEFSLLIYSILNEQLKKNNK